jgi:hypothetical protein
MVAFVFVTIVPWCIHFQRTCLGGREPTKLPMESAA